MVGASEVWTECECVGDGGGAGGGREWRREHAGRAGADGFTGDIRNEES